MPSARRRGRKPGFVMQSLKANVAVLRAEGMTHKGIAKTLGVSESTVETVNRLPEVKAHVQELRDLWKGLAHQAIQETAPVAWQMAHEAAQQRDYKGFDYSMRGLHAVEKISASVSGEGQKVEITGLPPSAPTVELKLLLQQLFQTSTGNE